MGENDQRSVESRQSPNGTADLEFVLTAAEVGYFDVPRETPLADLAEQEGISDIEATERIRRGVKELVARRHDRQ